jgi:hypothetical protein
LIMFYKKSRPGKDAEKCLAMTTGSYLIHASRGQSRRRDPYSWLTSRWGMNESQAIHFHRLRRSLKRFVNVGA